MKQLPAALAALAAWRQFIVYVLVPSATKPGKTDKLPIDYRTGKMPLKGSGGAHNPDLWTDHATAIRAAELFGNTYGVGFVFTQADPFFFLDIDNCAVNGQWSETARALCGYFAGAAIEVSQSGRGLHVIGTGKPPPHACRNEAYGLEFYSDGRFVALTGNAASGDAAMNCAHLLPGFVAQLFPPQHGEGFHEWTTSPAPDWRGPEDDAELIRRACRSKSAAAAFGNRASFNDLWTANAAALGAAYPDEGRPYNASQADAALAQHLAFWTGKDCERILRLMSRSALAREKWDREDYLPRTIVNAVSRQFEVLQDREPEGLAAAPATTPGEAPRPQAVQGSTFLSVEDQLRLFAGCVYIRDLHKVLTPGGKLLKSEQFKVLFGGYTFPLDTANERVTRDAWEAFTQSQAFRCPRADSAAFRPNMLPGIVFERGGQMFVNSYWPVDVPRKQGDPSRFFAHLAKVLPDARDQKILLSYMAACVQHRGYKFQWAPLLQGVAGNGKTLFSRCVAEAIGARYVHWPKASKLSAQFNAWLVGKLFYAVEDIFVAEHKAEVIEELKPMITGGDGLEIEGKGADQISVDICGNFIFNSNHKNAVRKTRNDRRFCTMFCAQQSVDDLERDGMTGDYFPNLYDWLRSDGYAIMAELLHTMPIDDEFNPATKCQRAPTTTSTAEAIEASRGSIEQEIDEAIAQGSPGFCGGWISTLAVDRLVANLGASRRLTHTKRKEMLVEMGYVLHPGLIDGRVNNLVMPDAGKPRLYLRKDSPHLKLTKPAEIAAQYQADNSKGFGNA